MNFPWRLLLSANMLVSFLMGFASGLPLMLTVTLLQAWMREAGINLTTIGLFNLVALPYTLKFLWAPLLDRYAMPFLGRRRGWMLVSQLLLIGAIVWLGVNDPARAPELTALAALLVTFFSASQDLVVDAYRRESLSDIELGPGAAFYQNGYRVGMLLAQGGGLILADHMSYSSVYTLMAGCMLIGVFTTLAVTEKHHAIAPPKSLRDAIVLPLKDYFSRDGAWLVLAFILLYKIGDNMAFAMTTPFFLDLGFTKTEIGVTVKLFGFWAIIGGGVLGAALMIWLGTNRSLWLFGVLQMISTAGYFVLAEIGKSDLGLAIVIAFDNLAMGMGTAALLAYMAYLTNRQFTAFQYALLSSLMGVPRVLVAAPTGWMAETLGWSTFFIICTLAALPGMILLYWCAPFSQRRPAVNSATGSV